MKQSTMIKKEAWLIAREGIPFVAGWLLLGTLGFLLHNIFLVSVSFLLGLFSALFFRNPKRVIPPVASSVILAPADGKIVEISEVIETRFLQAPCKKVSIFMSIFNVHINRSPIEGKISGIQYFPGKFKIAGHPKASLLNEQNALCIESAEGNWKMVCVQIAGMVARRIVCYPKIGERLGPGEIFGLIRFGSQVDIYLPLDSVLMVKKGAKVIGGVTILGEIKA